MVAPFVVFGRRKSVQPEVQSGNDTPRLAPAKAPRAQAEPSLPDYLGAPLTDRDTVAHSR